MKTMQFLIIVTLFAFVAGCAVKAPSELVNARAAYEQASQGPAKQLVPTELNNAHEALVRAEQSFEKDPGSAKTKDLAYVAQRKAELAGALGATAADKAKKEKADAEFQKKQAELVKQGKQDLSDTEKQQAETLAAMAAEQAGKDKADVEKRHEETLTAMTAEQARKDEAAAKDKANVEKRHEETLAAMTAEQARKDEAAAEQAKKDKAAAELQGQQAEAVRQGKQDLSDSEKRTADALAALAKLAAVKEEERGLVITLSGGVLFRSAQSTLLPSAQVKLDQVAKALLAVPARSLIVEGHTDSQGSESYNQGLSQRRADAVRDYLVQKGYPADRIQARGKGKGSPIADNASPEGRANNRRVEIVIERESQKPNPSAGGGAKMRTNTILGIILIVIAIVAFAYQGIDFTTREKVVDLGPVHMSADRTRTLPLPPIVGALALVGGVALLVVGSKKG